jgi:hypothetical protein
MSKNREAMTEALTPFEQEVESMARAVVDANQPMLNALGIRADYHGVIVRTATVGSRVSEVEIWIYREARVLDGLEFFVERNGRPAATIDEMRKWLGHELGDLKRSLGL